MPVCIAYNCNRGDKMNNFDLLVSPIYHNHLKRIGNILYDDNYNKYKIVKGVPVLLPKGFVADWHRELIEVILWEFPNEIEKIYLSDEWHNSPVEIYIEYIEKLLNNKQGIIKALENYSKTDTEKWIISKNNTISHMQKVKFKKFSKTSNGEKRTLSKIDAKGIFAPYPYFSEMVNKYAPQTIVELGMGAGGGTASVGLNMKEYSTLYAIDVGYECLGNAVGIKKYQKKNIVPICASFWYLPFDDNSVDAVCTFNGLDESREINKTIKEVSRILKDNGIFTVASRKNAFMRQASILEPFSFTKDETISLLDKCRIYTNVDNLCKLCNENNMILKSQKEFEINENLTIVVTQFKKQE